MSHVIRFRVPVCCPYDHSPDRCRCADRPVLSALQCIPYPAPTCLFGKGEKVIPHPDLQPSSVTVLSKATAPFLIRGLSGPWGELSPFRCTRGTGKGAKVGTGRQHRVQVSTKRWGCRHNPAPCSLGPRSRVGDDGRLTPGTWGLSKVPAHRTGSACRCRGRHENVTHHVAL